MRHRNITYGCGLAPLSSAALSIVARTKDEKRGTTVDFLAKLALSACLLTATSLGASAIGNLPDLVPTSLSYNSATGLFTVGVKNQGTVATPSNVVVGNGFFVDGTYVSWGAVPGPLAAGASVSITSSGGGAYTISPGTHTISVAVDDVNRIPESNENNNGLAQTITVGAGNLPDLVPTSLSYNSATGLFTVGVKNQGAAATPSNVVVGNGFFVDGTYVSWGAVPGPLAAGASVSITSSGGGAYTISPGTHTISVAVDDVNRIPESNENNNGLAQTITVGSPPPPPPPPPTRICNPPTNAYDTSSQFIFYPGSPINWTFPAIGSNANYTIADAYGNTLLSGTLNGANTGVKYTPPAGTGFYRLNIYSPSGSLIRMLTAATLPLPCNWSIGRNAFGAGTWGWGSWGFNQMYLARFGFSWRRGELDTIGLKWPASQTTIPAGTANLTAYQSNMQTYIANPANDTFDLDAPELWNEPTGSGFLNVPAKYSWNQYVAAFRAARAGILAAKPTWRVAMNQLDSGGFSAVNAAGGSNLYDIMAWHPYSASTWRNECKSAEQSGPWIYGTDLLSNFEIARTQVPFKESWSTEFGWPTAPGYGWSCTELQQAKFIVRSALLQLGQGFTHVLPFSLTNVSFWDVQSGSFGLNYGDGNLRPTMPKASMVSYAVLAQTIDDLPYVGRFACGVNCAEFLFGNSSASVLVFWNPQSQQAFSIASALPAGTAEIGLFGSRRNVGGAAYSVRMSDTPTYLVFNGIAPAQVVSLITQPYITGRAKGIFSGVTQ